MAIGETPSLKAVIYRGQATDPSAPKTNDGILYVKSGHAYLRNSVSILELADKAWSDARFVQLAGSAMTGELILSEAQDLSPSNPRSAVTKNWVEKMVQNIRWKQPVRAASFVNETLSSLIAGASFGGVTLAVGDRILVAGQTVSTENGIYEVRETDAPIRASDADVYTELIGATVVVNEGSYATKGYRQNTVLTNFDGQSWVQNLGSSLYIASGEGLELIAGVFTLELDGDTLSKSAFGLRVAIGGITNTEINSAAAIAWSKMAALTASRVPQINADGVIEASSVTTTELSHLSGVTSSIQDQLDSKVNLAGGTMTGELILSDAQSSAPANDKSAVSKVWSQTRFDNLTYSVTVSSSDSATLDVTTVNPKVIILTNTAERALLVTGTALGANLIEIKDATDSYTNPITVTLDTGMGTFEDSSTEYIIQSAGASVRFVRSGTVWYLL